MLKLKVNDIDVEVEEGTTVLQACEQAGAEIPRFCCKYCLLYTSPSPRDSNLSRMPSSA